MLEDQTNETIPLSIHALTGWGDAASLSVDVDFDSSFEPSSWVWLMFNFGDEPWFKLTLDEAERLYDRLGRILGHV